MPRCKSQPQRQLVSDHVPLMVAQSRRPGDSGGPTDSTSGRSASQPAAKRSRAESQSGGRDSPAAASAATSAAAAASAASAAGQDEPSPSRPPATSFHCKWHECRREPFATRAQLALHVSDTHLKEEGHLCGWQGCQVSSDRRF